MKNPIDWIAFDLDGTLLNDKHLVGDKDYATLYKLGKQNKLRIAATGRNHYSLCKLLPANFPMDYAIFSSGAGIMEWKTKKIIQYLHISAQNVQSIVSLLLTYRLNFSVHKAIPENHHMLLHAPHPLADDLINYTVFYKDFVEPFNLNNLPLIATQFIVLLNSHVFLYEQLKDKLVDFKTILTTSPVDKKSMWMEIFNPKVSKANGLKWLAEFLKSGNPNILAIGNDYNDIDLLEFANHSFVVENAPKVLKNKYPQVAGNNFNGFTEACRIIQQ
jgi:Cof subfamily protein (haloacid dehalogenase superfamily)